MQAVRNRCNEPGLLVDEVGRWQIELTRQLDCWTMFGPQTMLNQGIKTPKRIIMFKLRVQTVQGHGSALYGSCNTKALMK